MREKKNYQAPAMMLVAVGAAEIIAASTKSITFDNSTDQIEKATWDGENE